MLVAQGEVGHMSAPSPPPTVGRLGFTLQEFLNRRKMTEFGNLALIDQDAAEEGGVAIPLPGVKKGEQGVLSCPAVKPRRAVLSPAALLADSRVVSCRAIAIDVQEPAWVPCEQLDVWLVPSPVPAPRWPERKPLSGVRGLKPPAWQPGLAGSFPGVGGLL